MKYLTKTSCLLPFLFGLFFSFTAVAQTTLYSEDFSSQNGKGAVGSSTDLSGVSWSIDLTNATLSGTSDWFQVVNGVFEGRDVDGTQQSNGGGDGPVWISPSISISGYTNVSISISASESGTMEHQDFVRASYQIDGGTITQFAQEIDDFSSATLSTSGLSGSTLIIYIEMDNNAGSEYIRFDNVLVQGTPASTNDTDTEIFDTGSQIAGQTVTAANVASSGTAFDVFTFTIEDQGSGDGLPTDVTEVVLKPASSNTADWSDHIQGIVIDDGSSFISPSAVNITDTEITISINSGDLEVADGSSVDVTIATYLNTSNIVDGSVLAFEIPASGFDFVADGAGSGFTSSLFFGAVTGNDFTIDVDATELQFTTQPVNSSVSAVISQVDVAYTDANGNVDTDYDGSGFDIQLTTTGTFDGSATTTVQASNGVAAFDNLIFSATGTGLTLTATDQSTFIAGSYVSDLFDVSVGPVTLYDADFSNNGDGFADHTSSSPPASGPASVGPFGASPNQWSLSYDNTPATDGSSNSFKVVSGALESDDWGGQGIFESQSIDVSGISTVDITATSNNSGANDDNFKYFYILDGGSRVETDAYSSGAVNYSISGLDVSSFSTLVVGFEFSENGGGDGFRTTSYVVEGVPSTPSIIEYTGGAWSATVDGTTGAEDAVVRASENLTVSSAFSIDNFEVETGATVTINSGVTVTVNGDITNNGTINVSDGASLLQTTTTDNNSGSGTYNVTRNTGTLTDDTRFQYWSSPVASATMSSVFSGSNTNDFYTWDEGGQAWATGSSMTPGKGYITTGTIGITPGGNENRTFSGDVNNGDVDLSTSAANGGYILVGNPYPSSISFDEFMADNDSVNSIEGTIWFWVHNTPESGGNNSASDYASLNGSGGVAATTGGAAPVNYVSSCQGFFVQSSSTNPTIAFRNDQRVSGNNTQFFKNGTQETRERVWLNLTNDQEDFNQILVSFMPDATEGKDRMYDGRKFKAHPRIAFYSMMNADEYSIQGLPLVTPNETKVVPLGVDAWVTGEYTISLDSLDNWSDSYKVSLEDKLLNTSINLKDVSSYSFMVDSIGVIQNRFYLNVHNELSKVDDGIGINDGLEGEGTDNPTGIEELTENEVSIFRSGEELVINSELVNVEQVTVFDLSGRVVLDQAVETSAVRIPFTANGMFIVTVKTTDSKEHKAKINF